MSFLAGWPVIERSDNSDCRYMRLPERVFWSTLVGLGYIIDGLITIATVSGVESYFGVRAIYYMARRGIDLRAMHLQGGSE